VTDLDITRFAFHTVPQTKEQADGNWVAYYPARGWSVTGATKAEAMQRLRDEVMRRQGINGADPVAEDERIFRQHIREPIPGVYLMDNDLYLALKDKCDSQGVLEEAFKESERRRALGQTYTKDDYLREHGGDN
jgi:hypothetical protein